ncbi:MAG: NADH-quinone oxidoreductase subunit I, partial [Armatimonadetes bacterium]|nr:NADH-quinone oxidoreductase subunit I [Armatimonadota bacterium]
MNSKLKALINTPVSLVKGLTVTMANLVRTKTTVKYPEVMPEPAGRAGQTDPEDAFERPYELGPRFRGLHGLTKDPATGDLNCIGCMACAKVCPDDLISMDLEKREGHSGRYPVTFTVNIGPCCFCGLCAEVCPTPMRAIVMTDLFEWATYRRDGQNLVLTKDDLVRHGDLEVARRAGGRSWENGELTGVLPEEEGNPYFQFAPEYEAERKKGDKPAEGTAREKPEKPAGGQAKPER